jgi:hypothetical protein
MSKLISRASFIKGVLAASAFALGGKYFYDRKNAWKNIPCRMLGPSRRLGHLLRDRQIKPAPVTARLAEKRVVIVGGGIAGLSAAWWLKKNGFTDFTLLELEDNVGGNSSSGKNNISAFPWGAHYVPVANDESEYVRTLFEEFGIIESYDANGLPRYNELYLCHDPQERLYKDGGFQDGLVPHVGLQPEAKSEIERFFKYIVALRKLRGKDGKPAFAIPLDLSSTDEEIRALDGISMAQWLADNNYKSAALLWYIKYCCRDDYGSSPEHVSAWAGLHYFAGRTGRASNSEAYSVVTWPQGNGFLVEKLRDANLERIHASSLVLNIKEDSSKILTTILQTKTNARAVLVSDYLIFATPRFLSKYLIDDFKSSDFCDHAALEYAPWMVANIELSKLPISKGESVAWDNVSYYSDSLGYVVATHQNITTRLSKSVITYYYPLSKDSPQLERKKLLGSEPAYWREKIVMDLERMHPGIMETIISIELWPWGHGMIKPTPGFIWSKARQEMKTSAGKIFFAHSDMSGMSNFEEAQYHGVEAAKAILEKLGQT